jgi:hypothetical protein
MKKVCALAIDWPGLNGVTSTVRGPISECLTCRMLARPHMHVWNESGVALPQ